MAEFILAESVEDSCTTRRPSAGHNAEPAPLCVQADNMLAPGRPSSRASSDHVFSPIKLPIKPDGGLPGHFGFLEKCLTNTDLKDSTRSENWLKSQRGRQGWDLLQAIYYDYYYYYFEILILLLLLQLHYF